MNLNPKRLENETFEEYKERRKYSNKAIKIRLRGRSVRRTKREFSEYLNQLLEKTPEHSKYY